MMRIVLATDGSPQSTAAVHEVATSGFPADTQVRIVCAYERTPLITRLEPMGVMEESYAQADHYALQAAKEATEKAAEIVRAKNPTFTMTTVATGGSAKSVILKEAKALGADLIVIGSHGYGTIEGFLFGSVSHAVALHATCSVEIVRGTGTVVGGRKILLATDGSEASETVTDVVACQSYPIGTEVRVISVAGAPYMPEWYVGEGVDMTIYLAIEKIERETALETVEKAALKIRRPELNVTTAVLSGSPKALILDEAEAFGADLIVVGAHGYGAIERFLIGSISQAVALHAKCSVEIVRGSKTPSNESK